MSPQLFRGERYARAFFIALPLAAVLTSFAQTAAPEPAKRSGEEVVQLDKFVSIGSRFNDRTVLDSPVPIDVLTEKEVRNTGYSELTQVLQSQVPSFSFPRSTNVAGTVFQRPATLRGLSPDQTLVLVNGKRRYTSSLVNVNGAVGRGSQAVDLNALPTAAIGGVEVLRDGAAAQYGSDAIGGVINFTLRRTVGAEITTTVGENYEGDGRTLDTALNLGTPLGNSGGFLNATLFFQDRGYTARILPDYRQQYFLLDSVTGQPAALRANGTGTLVSTDYRTTAVRAGTVYDPREASFARTQTRWGDPDTDNRGLFINAELPVTKDTKFYAFGGYGFRNSLSATSTNRPGDDQNVRSVFPNGSLVKLVAEVADASFAGGFKGKLGEWNWDLSETWGRNSVDYWSKDTVNPSYGNASPSSFYSGQLAFQQATTNADFNRVFDIGRQHPLKVAFGAEYRWENYQIARGEDASWKDGGQPILDGPNAGKRAAVGSTFPGFAPRDETDATRNSVAGYADIAHQVTDKLLLAVAGRAEHYDDFGDTINGKVSGRYAFTPTFALRASANTGFRAPGLAQAYFTKTQVFTNTGNSGRALARVKTFPVNSAVARGLGARPLEAETSTNVSFGLTAQPLRDLTLSVDGYFIKVKDQIVLSSNFINPINVTTLENFIATTDPLSAGADGASYFTNAIDVETRGLDFTARYRWKLADNHVFTFTLGANFNRNEVTKIVATSPDVAALTSGQAIFDPSQVGRIEHGTPRKKGVLTVGYELGKKLTVTVRQGRYGTTTNVDTSGVLLQTYGAKWTTDLDLTYRFTPKISLTVGANNLFDEYPDASVPTNTNVVTVPYSQSLSPFGFNGGYYYTRLEYKF